MKRRDFLRYSSATALGFLASSALVHAVGDPAAQHEHFEGQEIFNRIISKAAAEKWQQLAIGELIGKIAMELKDTPYVGFTLELSPDSESCVVNLKGLD